MGHLVSALPFEMPSIEKLYASVDKEKTVLSCCRWMMILKKQTTMWQKKIEFAGLLPKWWPAARFI